MASNIKVYYPRLDVCTNSNLWEPEPTRRKDEGKRTNGERCGAGAGSSAAGGWRWRRFGWLAGWRLAHIVAGVAVHSLLYPILQVSRSTALECLRGEWQAHADEPEVTGEEVRSSRAVDDVAAVATRDTGAPLGTYLLSPLQIITWASLLCC